MGPEAPCLCWGQDWSQHVCQLGQTRRRFHLVAAFSRTPKPRFINRGKPVLQRPTVASWLVGAATGRSTEGGRPPVPFWNLPLEPAAVAVRPVPVLQPAAPLHPAAALEVRGVLARAVLSARHPPSSLLSRHRPPRPHSLSRGPSEQVAALLPLWGSQACWATPWFSKYIFLVS